MRTPAILALTVLLTACTASSDDVGAVGEDDTNGRVAEGVAVCPDNLVLDVDDFPEQALPQTTDYAEFHQLNGERDGVETTASGMQYTVVQAGLENGLTPAPGEEVFANYHGFRTDGTVFDSSYTRGQPFITPTNRVIRGWTESLEGMKVCEARTIYLPAELAYGQRGAGADIRPGDSLVFHMQLLRVNREGDPVGIDD